MLYKQGQPVTSKEAKTLRRAYLSQDLLQHMKQRENWKSESTSDKICCIAHQRALQRMNLTDKNRLHKFIHKWLPTNKKLHDYNKEQTNKCPSCNATKTNDHVTACGNTRRKQMKTKTTANLAKLLNKYYTCPQIKEIILTGVKKIWQGDYNLVTSQDMSFTPKNTLKQTLEDQNKIGWTNLYRGRIALEWQTAQQRILLQEIQEIPRHRPMDNDNNHNIMAWIFTIVGITKGRSTWPRSTRKTRKRKRHTNPSHASNIRQPH
jgi:hypothetical protein